MSREQSMIRRPVSAALILLGSLFLAASEGGFFEEIPDLPIMPALTADPEASAAFDTPGGRIVSVSAKGEVARATVLDYYGSALPQLGWEPEAKTRFRREAERLRIEFIEGEDGLTVRFVLSPI
jgi:hypothetical protein